MTTKTKKSTQIDAAVDADNADTDNADVHAAVNADNGDADLWMPLLLWARFCYFCHQHLKKSSNSNMLAVKNFKNDKK